MNCSHYLTIFLLILVMASGCENFDSPAKILLPYYFRELYIRHDLYSSIYSLFRISCTASANTKELRTQCRETSLLHPSNKLLSIHLFNGCAAQFKVMLFFNVSILLWFHKMRRESKNLMEESIHFGLHVKIFK